jgi:hypothetical protein
MRPQLEPLSDFWLIQAGAQIALTDDLTDAAAAMRHALRTFALRTFARRWLDLHAEIAIRSRHLKRSPTSRRLNWSRHLVLVQISLLNACNRRRQQGSHSVGGRSGQILRRLPHPGLIRANHGSKPSRVGPLLLASSSSSFELRVQ